MTKECDCMKGIKIGIVGVCLGLLGVAFSTNNPSTKDWSVMYCAEASDIHNEKNPQKPIITNNFFIFISLKLLFNFNYYR